MTVILIAALCLVTCAVVELASDDCPCEHLPEFDDLTEVER